MFPRLGALLGMAGLTIGSMALGASSVESLITVFTVAVGIAVIPVTALIAVPAPGSPGCGPEGVRLGVADAVGRGVEDVPEKSSGRVDAEVGTARDTRSFDGT